VAWNPVPFEAWNLLRYLGFDDWDLGFAALGSVRVTDNTESDAMDDDSNPRAVGQSPPLPWQGRGLR
jgi:hypothetical protein